MNVSHFAGCCGKIKKHGPYPSADYNLKEERQDINTLLFQSWPLSNLTLPGREE